MREPRLGRRLGSTALVTVAALTAFAVIGGTGLAGGLAKPFKAQYGPGQYLGKVTICHKGKVTIRVSINAWPAHRDRHGDTMGPCSAATSTAAKLKAAKAKAGASKAENGKAATDVKAAAKAAGKAKHANKGQSSSTEDEAQGAEAPATTHGPPPGHGNGNGKKG